jgi:predicted phage-related endonuclease
MVKCKNSCPTDEFEGCCFHCDLKEKCEVACKNNPSECADSIIDEESSLQVFQQNQLMVLKQIAEICTSKKKLEEQEKNLKQQLKDAMETCGIKKFTSDILNITYVAATTSTTVDSQKLKDKHPDIYNECSKVSNKSAYIKVEVK